MANERTNSVRSRPLTSSEAVLVDTNTRLAWWTANRVYRRVSSLRPPHEAESLFEDLLDASFFGLTCAAKTFDPGIGRFSTYAVQVMQSECYRFLQRLRVKLPPPHLSFISLQGAASGGSGSGDPYSDFVPDSNAVNPEDAAVRGMLPDLLASAIRKLPENDAEVIRRRYLSGQSLNEIGAAIGRTRQRAHQIERRALARLRRCLCEEGFATVSDLL